MLIYRVYAGTYYLPRARPAREKPQKQNRSTITMVAPTGVEARIEMKIPKVAHTTEITAEQRITLLKLRNTLMADSAGNIIRAEVSSAPTRFIASTIITAVTTATIML